jgi:hypothetical protein
VNAETAGDQGHGAMIAIDGQIADFYNLAKSETRFYVMKPKTPTLLRQLTGHHRCD